MTARRDHTVLFELSEWEVAYLLQGIKSATVDGSSIRHHPSGTKTVQEGAKARVQVHRRLRKALDHIVEVNRRPALTPHDKPF